MNKIAPKISILMSVYNGSHYLKESIESILSQTFTDFEFIIIEDCSTDNSKEIIIEYAELDDRIVLIKNEENIGLTKSLNKGLKAARGKYIARQDADDISLPERFEKQLLYMESNPSVALLSTGVQYIDDTGKELWTDIPPKDSIMLRWQLLFRNPIRHSTVLWRREIVDRKVGNYDPNFTYSQDYDLWARIAENFMVDSLPIVLVKMTWHNKSISLTKASTQDSLATKVSYRQMTRYFPNENLEIQDVTNLKLIPHRKDKLQRQLFAELNHDSFKKGAYKYLELWQKFCQAEGVINNRQALEELQNEVQKSVVELLKHCNYKKWFILGGKLLLFYLYKFPGRSSSIAKTLINRIFFLASFIRFYRYIKYLKLN